MPPDHFEIMAHIGKGQTVHCSQLEVRDLGPPLWTLPSCPEGWEASGCRHSWARPCSWETVILANSPIWLMKHIGVYVLRPGEVNQLVQGHSELAMLWQTASEHFRKCSNITFLLHKMPPLCCSSRILRTIKPFYRAHLPQSFISLPYFMEKYSKLSLFGTTQRLNSCFKKKNQVRIQVMKLQIAQYM